MSVRLSSVLSYLLNSPSKTENRLRISVLGEEESLPEKLEIDNITHSSGKANPKSVFVCIKGSRHDGNDFLNEAKSLGARVFVSERQDLKIDSGVLIFSNNPRKTMAEIAKLLYGIPKEAMITVGITGTKGKSTVAELLSNTLRTLGIKTLSVGTLGATLDRKTVLENTTPDSSVLYPLIRRAFMLGARVCVIEVSSQALKDYRVWGIEFDIVAFTSFGTDHIGKGEHDSFSDYLSAKRSLFTSYGAKSAVVNYDDAYSSYFKEGVREVIRCGMSRGADLKIENLRQGFFGMRFSISGIDKRYRISGRFNTTNIAIAAAIAEKISGAPLEEILEKISKMRVEGRFQAQYIHSRFAIIDYAHNETSLKEMISSVREITKGRIILVFGSVGDRSVARRRELSGVASSLADFSVITSDNPGYENPYEIAEEIYSGFRDKARAKIVVDRERAIRYAFAVSRPGDVILLLGKGHEKYMFSEGKRLSFSETQVLSKIKKEGIPEI